MAGTPVYEYPDREELVDLLRASTQYAVADKIGCSRSALQNQLRKLGITVDEYRQPKSWAARKKDQVGDLSISEEEVLRQRVRELESALRKDRKQSIADERLIRAAESSAAAALPVYASRKPKVKKKVKGEKVQHEMVLLWSDTHAGEVVSGEETNGINEYNWDIMQRRQHRIKEAVYSYVQNRPYPIEKLHVLALGDMLSGNIHDELAETNEMPFGATIVEFATESAAWLAGFGDQFQQITFSGIVGNHPRAHRKPRAKQAYDNGDWLVYRWMQSLLKKNKQVKFDIPKASQHVVRVQDKNIMLFHGDSVRSNMPGVPWGGVLRRVNALGQNYAKQAHTPIDIYACGHFHTASFVQSDAGQVILNGSVKGVDEYSIKAFGGGRPAQQVLLTFHERHGVTDMSMIDLQEV